MNRSLGRRTSNSGRVVRSIAACAAAALLPTAAVAQGRGGPVPPEGKAPAKYVAQLPKYCYGQFVDGALRNNPQYTIVGCGVFMNHFCYGLVFLAKAGDTSLPKHERKVALHNATSDVAYTVKGMERGCPIAPDVAAAQQRVAILQTLLK